MKKSETKKDMENENESQGRVFRVSFSNDNEDDTKILHDIEQLRSFSKSVHNKGLSVSIIMKKALTLVTKENILSWQRETLSEEESLKIWAKGWNEKNNSKLSPISFAIKILPDLRRKELKELEDLVLNTLSSNETQIA